VQTLDRSTEQSTAGATPAILYAHGNSQQFCLIGRQSAQGKADLLSFALNEQADGARRGGDFGDVLPCPGALAQGCEGRAVQGRREVEVERAERAKGEPFHSVDRPPRAVGQRDVDATQVKRPRQAFSAIAFPPTVGPLGQRQTGDRGRVRQGDLRDGIDEPRSKRRGFGPDDETGSAAKLLRKSLGRGEKRRLIICSNGTEPIAEMAVDGGDSQTAARRARLGKQGFGRGNTGKGHGEGHGKTARGGEADAQAGKAARPDCDGDQRQGTLVHAGLPKGGGNDGHQPGGLIAALLALRGQHGISPQDRNAEPAHCAVKCQNDAHARLAFTRLAGLCADMKPDLVAIAAPEFDVDVALAYATNANLTGRPVYRNAECWLHRDAAEKLAAAVALARPLGLGLRIFDALRPVEAQWALWNARPDAEFLADPRRGSPHSRGVAVDLTLLDREGRELDMGTNFDAFTPRSHHGRTDLPVEAQRNRLLLMGLMAAAGWDFYRNEWWHYQLFDARRYPLVSDVDLPRPMM
jgi:zinc D-Ala-D-Ala dipeptidase